MAKHCDVCNQDYADELAACPYCAAAKKTQMVTRSDERVTQLAKPDEEPVSEQPSPLQPQATPADSAINLGSPPPPVEVVAGDSAVVMAELASNSSPVAPVSDSGVDLTEGEVMEETEENPEAAEAAPAAEESALDVTKPEQPAASASDVALESLMSEETPSSEPAAPGSAVSQREEDELLGDLDEVPAESAATGETEQEAAEIAEGEEGIAAAMTEQAAEADETEAEEKPAKPAKPRSNVLVLAGTTFLGILLGVGGTYGVRAVMGPGEKEKPALPVIPQAAKAAPAFTFEMMAARVAGGDWDEAKNAGIEQVPGANAKELVARGEYHLFGTYLKNVGSKINPQDPALHQALQDLQKAAEQKDPDALYDLALIKELAGQLPEARAEYAKAAQAFANDPVQKQRFESAVKRVDLKTTAKPAGASWTPQRNGPEGRLLSLALLLIALQQPQPQQQPQAQAQLQQPQQAEAKEAGFEFWEAAKLAQQGKFEEAIRTLDRARKLHEQLRFTRLRKAQNPLSDPAEEIFLRCCDELKVYWQLENRLREGGYLSDKNTPPEALQAVLQKIQESTAANKDLSDKLAAAQKGQKDAEARAADLENKVQEFTKENTKLAGDLKVKVKTIEERDAALATAKKDFERLKGDYDKNSAVLSKVRSDLAEAKLLGPNDKESVGEAVKKAIEVAKSRDPQGTIRRQQDQIAQLSASLKERRPPEEMLPLWLLILDEDRSATDLAEQAAKDAQRVLTDPRAAGVQKAKAQVVLGLALRNTGKFAEAKMMLETARGAVGQGEWLARAEAALKEASNPAAYFTSQAQSLYDRGRLEEAMEALARAMKVLPEKEQGKLLAQRGLMELDAARSKTKGMLPPTEPLLNAARKDAEAAIQAGAAEGHYAAGRIAEELGQIDAAIRSYRAALAAHGGRLDAEGGRYRVALARVLLLPRQSRPSPAVAPAGTEPNKVGLGDTKNLIVMLTLGLQAPLVPGEETAGQEEAEKLADEVLKAPPGTVPFTVLAQALAVKGRWNQALQAYVEGIRTMLPREYADGMVYLLSNDPRLKRPDSLRTPNPLEAEKHFAAGLNFYFDRDYANAEKEFLLTIENDSQDARFFYFLGLARLAQDRRRDAYADFSEGARLERLNRPSSAAVSEALERIQGPTRLLINEFRQGPER